MFMKVCFTKLYYEQGCLKKDVLDRCFHTALNPFLIGFLGLFLDGEVQDCTPVITFDRDMLQPQKSSKYIDHHKFFQKLLKRVS